MVDSESVDVSGVVFAPIQVGGCNHNPVDMCLPCRVMVKRQGGPDLVVGSAGADKNPRVLP